MASFKISFSYLIMLMTCAVCFAEEEVTTANATVASDNDDKPELGGRSMMGAFPASLPNPCLHHGCMNGGRCAPYGTSYTCQCFGYSGSRCEIPIIQAPIYNPCSSNPCMNGAFCQVSGNTYTCQCSGDYYGSRCESRRVIQAPVNPCANNPCLNGGICRRSGHGYTCQCSSSYGGPRCESLRVIQVPVISPCAHNPCLHGGACIVSGNGFTCQCSGSYYGAKCELMNIPRPNVPVIYQRGVCFPNPCMNGCQCVESCRHSSGYYCQSNNGYLGKNCTIPPPMLRCDPNQVIISVDDSFVREYDLGIGNSRLVMSQTADAVGRAGQSCYPTSNGISHTFTVPLPYSQCGTTVQDPSGTNTVVVNNIWLNRFTNGGYDMPVPVICFECTYTKEYSIISSLQPAFDQPPVIRNVGKVHERGVIELCKIQSCPVACPALYSVTQGAVYTVGETINLSIRGGGSMRGIVQLRTLFLSCDGTNAQSLPVVNLVSNGCPAYGTTNAMPTLVTHSGISDCACVSFQVPRLRGCSTFFIHAQLQLCQGACPRNCNRGRKRRSIVDPELDSEGYDLIDDVHGPIYVIEGAPGIPRKILFPDRTILNTTAMIVTPDIPKRRYKNPNSNSPAEGVTSDISDSSAIYITIATAVFLIIIFVSVVLYFRIRPSSYSKTELISIE